MILLDVNVLVEAGHRDAGRHGATADWLSAALGGSRAIGLADALFVGAVRVLTHRKVFTDPATPTAAWAFIDSVCAKHPRRDRSRRPKRPGAGSGPCSRPTKDCGATWSRTRGWPPLHCRTAPPLARATAGSPASLACRSSPPAEQQAVLPNMRDVTSGPNGA